MTGLTIRRPPAVPRVDRPTRRAGRFVALLGPDGAGKTTLAKLLSAEPELRALRFYMGRNPNVSRLRFPFSGALRRHWPGARSGPTTCLTPLVKLFGFGHLLLEQWICYGLAYRHRLAGGVVLFDRYVCDPLQSAARQPLGSRIRRSLLHAGAPTPDLVLILDAPAAVLHARKPEHDLDRLERMRSEYRALAMRLPNARLIDTSRPIGVVYDELLALIRSLDSTHGNRDP